MEPKGQTKGTLVSPQGNVPGGTRSSCDTEVTLVTHPPSATGHELCPRLCAGSPGNSTADQEPRGAVATAHVRRQPVTQGRASRPSSQRGPQALLQE